MPNDTQIKDSDIDFYVEFKQEIKIIIKKLRGKMIDLK